jgi:hypothetical protein
VDTFNMPLTALRLDSGDFETAVDLVGACYAGQARCSALRRDGVDRIFLGPDQHHFLSAITSDNFLLPVDEVEMRPVPYQGPLR